MVAQLSQLGHAEFIRGIGPVWLMAQFFKPGKIQIFVKSIRRGSIVGIITINVRQIIQQEIWL